MNAVNDYGVLVNPEIERRLKPFSPPFDREIDDVVRIADYFEEHFCREILKKHGIDIKKVEAPHHQTAYFFYKAGEPAILYDDTNLYPLPVVKDVCSQLESGEISFED